MLHMLLCCFLTMLQVLDVVLALSFSMIRRPTLITLASSIVTPSESDLCKFQRFPPNPHRNDSKVPTRHFRAGGKRSNNITQQSSMGPTEQIYIQHDSMSQEYRYAEQRPKSPGK